MTRIHSLRNELLKELKEDILLRYNNSEYWDDNLIDQFIYDHKISNEDFEKIWVMMR